MAVAAASGGVGTRLPVLEPKGRPVLDSGLPLALASHKSGGRDVWSPPMEETPEDLDAALWACLDEVLDPEIPISLVDLGLIYGASMEGGQATLRLTFTATACPCMDFIREDITDRLEQEHWISSVEIEEVWDPPWSRALITDRGRSQLKEMGMGA